MPLNQTILNGTCTDLQRASQYDDNYLLMMCETITFDQQGQRIVYTTLVEFEDLAQLQFQIMPTVRYLSYIPTKVKIDMNIGLINLG